MKNTKVEYKLPIRDWRDDIKRAPSYTLNPSIQQNDNNSK